MNANDPLPAVQSALAQCPERCPRCGERDFVRAGHRRTRDGLRQLYRCNRCFHRFSVAPTGRLRTPPAAVLDALTLACQEHTYTEILFALRKRHRVEVAKGTLSKWMAAFQPPYLKTLFLNRNHRRIVQSHLFTHGGINYNFKVHLPKLGTCPHVALREYLEHIPERLDPALFDRPPPTVGPSAPRCSQLSLTRNAGLKAFADNPVSRLAARILPLAASSRQRHPVIEEFFLCCDRNTIAIEVPVYLFVKGGPPVTGHIDILQWNFGKIQILDYKPNADKEKPEKVITQLTLYAMALSQRTKISVSEITCAYFDEKNLFQFTPVPFFVDTKKS